MINLNTQVFNHNLILSGEFAKDFNNENARLFCSLAFLPGGNISLKAYNELSAQQLAEIFQQLADKLKQQGSNNLIITP